jgi:excisionase family DNA binding protein
MAVSYASKAAYALLKTSRTKECSAVEEEQLLVRPRHGAKLLGVSPSKFYALLKSGDVPSIRLGKRALRVPLSALRRLAESATAHPESQDK